MYLKKVSTLQSFVAKVIVIKITSIDDGILDLFLISNNNIVDLFRD